MTGSSLVALRSHHDTTMLSPSAVISTSCESVSVVLLRFILSLNVEPLSLDDLSITSSLPVSFVHHVMYVLSPDIAIGAPICAATLAGLFFNPSVAYDDVIVVA